MLRLYDVRAARIEPIRPAHPGELRVLAGASRADDGTPLARFRCWLLTDLIRRCADRRGRLVTVCEIAGPHDRAAADTLRAERAALNIHPAEHTASADEPIARVVGLVDPAGYGAPQQPGRAGIPTGDPAPFDLHVGADLVAVARYAVAAPGRVIVDGAGPAGPGPIPARPRDVADEGLDPLALRLALLGRRYREPLRLTWDTLRAANETLLRWRARVADWARSPSAPVVRRYADAVVAAFDDDLDTPAALHELHALETDGREPAGAKFETFAAMDRLLGLDLAVDIGKPVTDSGQPRN